jgi:hypothetical protein
MAIDFPVPTQVGQQFTDSTSNITYTCAQVGPPAVWTCGQSSTPTSDEFVTIATTQTISGVKTFSGDPTTFQGDLATPGVTIYSTGGIQPTLVTITAGSFDLQAGVNWTCGAIDIPNPTNAQPGMAGTILLTAQPGAWGAAFKYPNGAGNTQPDTASYPAIVPYFVQDSSNILLGTPIAY